MVEVIPIICTKSRHTKLSLQSADIKLKAMKLFPLVIPFLYNHTEEEGFFFKLTLKVFLFPLLNVYLDNNK